jgi:UDP-glucose 4-epimerase
VLVTGATGWIGQAFLAELQARGIAAIAVTRRAPPLERSSTRWIQVEDDFAGLAKHWPEGVAAVVHLAARVHHMRDHASALALYRSTNCDATLRLAELARERGVARFIFISSVKALGEVEPGHPWRETDLPMPTDPYGISKLEAETGLKQLAGTHFSPTIVRIPLVYGAGVSANFASLIKAVQRGIPLPLGSVAAPRSLLGMRNLIEALMACVECSEAAGQLLHIADQEALPVRELVKAIGAALGRRARLVNVPPALLQAAGRLLGRSDQIGRLISPQRLDIRHAQNILGWTPRHPLGEDLRAACAAFQQ